MNSLTIADHALFLLVFVVFPTYSAVTIKSVYLEVLKVGEPARLSVYKRTVLTTLVMALAIVFVWLAYDRPWPELGFRWPGPLAFAVSLIAALLAVWIFVQPLRAMIAKRQVAPELSPDFVGVGAILPFTAREERWFRVVSTNAGVSEEIIYRGYLIWYLSQIVPAIPAAVLAVLLFGLAHAYQGWKQVPGIMLVSAIAVCLYVTTDSLLVPIIFHIVLDAAQGYYIAKARQSVTTNGTLSTDQE